MDVNTSAPADTGNADTSVNETAEVVEQSTPAAQPPAKPQSMKEKFKFVIDGEEREEEVDLSDKEALRRELQLSRAAKKRMTEAVEAKRKAFEIIKAFEGDPSTLLKRLGPKGREIAENFLSGQIKSEVEDASLTPEQKRIRELETKLMEKEEREANEKKSAEERKLQEAEYKFAQQFQKTIIDAVEKSGMPKSPELIKRMAAIMKKNLEFGLTLTPDDLVAEVRADLTALIRSIVKDAEGDHIINMFGAEIANKVRKSDIKRLQEKQPHVFGQTQKRETSTPAPEAAKRPQTIDEWKADLNRRVKDWT